MATAENKLEIVYYPVEDGKRKICLAIDTKDKRETPAVIEFLLESRLVFGHMPVACLYEAKLEVTGLYVKNRMPPHEFRGLEEIRQAVQVLLSHPEDKSITYFSEPYPLPKKS